MKRTVLIVLALFSSIPIAQADTITGKIQDIRSCKDASGTWVYVVRLGNGLNAFNYVANPSDVIEDRHRKNMFAQLLSAFHAKSTVSLFRYNSGLMRCEIENVGEIKDAVSEH